MNKKSILIGGIIVVSILLLLVLRRCQESKQSSTAENQSQPPKLAPILSPLSTNIPSLASTDAKTKMNLLYLTPISFYGRVIDQDGVPVSGAKVDFSANTRPWEDGEKFSTISDGSGNFEVTGKHGRSLFVSVSKDGYYRLPESKGKLGSKGGFAYGSDLGNGVHSPSKASPVVFVLRKAGTIEPLVARHEIRVPLMPDGTVYPVSLRQSRGVDHRMLLSCRSEAMPETGGAFNWSFEVKIEDGELIDRTDNFAFEAPTSGYRATDSTAMSKSMSAGQWKDRVTKSYFIRFFDGTVARAVLDFHAGSEPHVWLDSYLNPKVGSRNLEAGPPKPIER